MSHSKDEAQSALFRIAKNPLVLVAGFASLNVAMYFSLEKFWIGGSSFLPMVGEIGKNGAFLFSAVVNVGVIAGAFLGAVTSGEFNLRAPRRGDLLKAVLGGFMIGVGVTLAPGTCTTAFVTGMPMLSVWSFLSAAGIFIGAFLVFSYMTRRR